MNEIIKKRKELEKQERIDRILKAARELFLEKGYLNTSMRNISVASELSTGAIYFYFKKKDDIYFKICEEAMDLLHDMLEGAYDKRKSGLENLQLLATAYIAFYRGYQDHYQLLDTITLWRNLISSDISKNFQPKMKKLLSWANKAVQSIFKEKGIATSEDSWAATFNLWAGIEGLFTIDKMGQLNDYDYSFEDLIKKQLEIFNKGLG